jgi:pimeloyl-ACP methyl ester carboxylesterase
VRRVAVCLHGFLRTGAAMWWVARRLRADGYQAVQMPTFGYHLAPLATHAARAAELLAGIARRHPDARLDLVTHSYGGVLARAALARPEAPAVGRLVMLAPPNQGARWAGMVRGALPVHRLGWDPLGQVLPGVPCGHGVPAAEVGILAGGTGEVTGFNPWLGADNDGTVRVDETVLEGATAHRVLRVHHSMMPIAPLPLALTLRFLARGDFVDGPSTK